MEDYRELAIRYLKFKKKRSRNTIVGASIAVMVIFICLNVVWSYLLNYRAEIREKDNYEIVLLCGSKDKILEVATEDIIESAYEGKYFKYDYYEPETIDYALYINLKNPYNMDNSLKYLEEKYDVYGYENYNLSWTYLQGTEGSSLLVLLLLIIFVVYIIAIFGVGIVRNSIQLTVLEQIKDFGNLRCIGSSGNELSQIIYIQGAILETIGIVIGVIAGGILSLLGGWIMGVSFIGFHLIPVVPIAICFYGDLYFAMKECSKLVLNMSPNSAIRGEYRIKQSKLKARGKSIFGVIFGVEGDYAYKNLMRNKGRFIKTVTTLTIGMAGIMTIIVIVSSLAGLISREINSYGYYNIYFNLVGYPEKTPQEMSKIPSSFYEEIKKIPGCEAAKYYYQSSLILADTEDYRSHRVTKIVDSDDANPSQYTEDRLTVLQYLDRFLDSNKHISLRRMKIEAYDEQDMQMLLPYLEEGTIELSENGVLIVDCYTERVYESLEDMTGVDLKVKYLDYKVGDKIQVFDSDKYQELYNERYNEIYQEYLDAFKKIEEEINQEEEPFAFMEAEQEASKILNEKQEKLVEEVEAEMKANKYFKELVVEGVVSKNVFLNGNDLNNIITTRDNYYKLMNCTENDYNGMMFHFKNVSTVAGRIQKLTLSDIEYKIANGEIDIEGGFVYSLLPELISEYNGYIYAALIVGAFILFLLSMCIFNIVNTTESSLHMRKQEFAQLRVIGVSKKNLTRMVMMEGIMSAIVAGFFGCVVGYGVTYASYSMFLKDFVSGAYHFPWLIAFISIIIIILVLCLTIYVPFKKLDLNVARDLTTAGE